MPKDIFASPEAVLSIIRLELELHPLARPIDLYKLLMQAAYGPGHLISDLEQAQKAIILEMAEVRSYDDEPYQSLDAGAGYIRYSLCNLLPYKAKGAIAFRDKTRQLAATMLSSCDASHVNPDLCELWKAWQHIPKNLIKATEEEWDQVHSLAAINGIASHSAIYKAAYQPHYRVIKRSLLSAKENI